MSENSVDRLAGLKLALPILRGQGALHHTVVLARKAPELLRCGATPEDQ